MVNGNIFHCRKHSWPAEDFVGRTALQLVRPLRAFLPRSLDFDGGAPPEQAWRRKLNSHANLLKEFSVTFMEAMRMMSLGLRLWSYVREEASHGRKAPIDPFTKERCKPSASQGVPLGGMGSGSISRGFRGEFKNWHIIPGLCESSPVMENQFSIFVSRDGGNKKYSSVLAPGHHEGEPDPDLKISCRQISPFIPHDYKDSSLPTSVFVYTNVNVTVLPVFGLSGENHVSAKEMWNIMKQNGHFDRENFSTGSSMPSSPGQTLCSCLSLYLGRATWRYTQFYGTSERSAINLVHDALTKYKLWEEEIEKWQNPILKDERLPECHAKLPAVHDGDSMSNSDEDSVSKFAAVHGPQMQEQTAGLKSEEPIPYLISKDGPEHVGKFLYLEGVEYIMWNTYDVHFYASFALLDLFPKIELSIQRDFANAVLYEDRRKVKFLADGTSGIRKVKGAVPHDLGTHDPWHEMNAYNIHDTSKWKDLNPKFVLQIYRDFAATGDMSFGRDVWPAVCAAVDYMDQFDRDGDGLIENDGFPDQTYDAWTVHGISAYCGCLWLAALQAAATMAHRLGERHFAEKYKLKFIKAKAVYEAKLWNGSYFNYDSGTSSNSRSIQADQLAGQWYTASSGLPPLFDDNKIKSALQKIFEFNVMKVKGGRMGAVNGMTPKGKVDDTCMQSREIWTGVTYAVAANMLLHGLEHQGFTTAEGIFTAGWSEEGYGYVLPCVYRAISD
ncbi:hypothetical protein PR202_gb08272 [Eleusine coracana subsp. coracana]|uniref:Non-lysosomal glucosylceramidase n=1 Tax=Eleusine coracana subsp. coracana TaxID=191504 RepID=A0AAV5EF40_ELECO|nr:hypothetical protein PR202_gb08272 [Eleusine coracana subsp. coracana]